MRIVKAGAAILAIALLAACGSLDVTSPQACDDRAVACGYIGSDT